MLRMMSFVAVIASTTPALAAEDKVVVRPTSEYLTDFVRTIRERREAKRWTLDSLQAERARRQSGATSEPRLFETSLMLPVGTTETPVAGW